MTVQKKRRISAKTDYAKRIRLLKSGTPRIVFRRTNKYIISQYVSSKAAQDKVELVTNSKELLNHGWPKNSTGSLKSITASYITGFFMGKKILKKKLEKPIIDFGMIKTLHKTKVFAFIKGLIDGGIDIRCKKESFPSEERIKGNHLKNKIDFQKIKTNIENEK